MVEALSVKLSQSEKRSLGTVHTDNLEAYELFVRAKAAPYPPIPERIGAAREMFETVIEMAPDFSGGYAGAAAMIGFSALWSHDDVWRDASRAEEFAGHAIAADNTFAWSYTALGLALLLQKKYMAKQYRRLAKQYGASQATRMGTLILGLLRQSPAIRSKGCVLSKRPFA